MNLTFVDFLKSDRIYYGTTRFSFDISYMSTNSFSHTFIVDPITFRALLFHGQIDE